MMKLLEPVRFLLDAVRILAMKDSVPGAVQIFWCWLGFKMTSKQNRFRAYQCKLAGHVLDSPLYNDSWENFYDLFMSQDYWCPLPAAPRIIDCGSNVGFAAYYFKLQSPDASIVCFEPSPVTFAYLKQNVENIGLSNVTLVQAACGTENGTIELFVDPKHSTGSTTKEIWDVPMEKCEVRQVRLSDFIDASVDLLKLDVEGAEWDVMEDLEKADKLKFVERMVIEFHHNLTPDKSNMGMFLHSLERAGFVYTVAAARSRAARFRSDWQSIMLHAWRPQPDA